MEVRLEPRAAVLEALLIGISMDLARQRTTPSSKRLFKQPRTMALLWISLWGLNPDKVCLPKSTIVSFFLLVSTFVH
jgi:hypothetical protein